MPYNDHRNKFSLRDSYDYKIPGSVIQEETPKFQSDKQRLISSTF
jgi:hypothetical protein